jgi:hypothetical protein
MKTKNTWGGPRPGAGRPKGSGKGRRVVTRSINLPPEVWAEIDRLRGPLSRSKWIKKLVEMLPQLKDLLAERSALERMIADTPADEVIDLRSLQARLDAVSRKLEVLTQNT